MWDVATGQPLGEVLKGHLEQINSLDFSPDGNMLASGSFDDTILLWDSDRISPTFGQTIAALLKGHDGNIWSVAFSPDGRLLASGGADGKIFIWDVDEGSHTFGKPSGSNLSGHEGIVTSLAFSSVGRIRLDHLRADSVEWVSPAKLGEVVSLVLALVESLREKPLDWTRETSS